ncbi:MAG TPA: carboxypeptidase regulatory-like domain-containing protein [Terriglobia bacterium]|nr:carboxypeptidase regulatory-like domain-containing protein [Terriglobia bacterium]
MSAAFASSFLAAAVWAQSGSTSLSGQVTDPSGLAIPAVTVEITGPGGAKLVAQTDDQGRYVFRNLPAGAYTVRINLKGFANFEKPDVVVAAGKPQVANAQLVVALEKQQITVEGEANHVSVSSENNASSLVIKGKDLEALSDDPDELESDLQALAGPSAGPNGGQIYIDGFTGGQLPPKSDILEIRVNQNPFSAEYDRVGYGRIEITTKPGANQYHGQFMVNGNASAFNSRNPFAGQEPPYHSEFFNGNFGGPLNKKAAFFVDAFRRNIQDDSVVSAFVLSPDFTQQIPFSQAVLHPQTRTNISPRVDYQVSAQNVLSMRYQWWHNTSNNSGIGQFALPSQAYNSSGTEHTLQISDTQILSDRAFNQTRFQYLHEGSNQTPQNLDPTLNVIGGFTGGGYAGGTGINTEDHYELQNLTSILVGKHSVVFGARLRDLQESNTSSAGFNGTFTFPSLAAYQAAALALRQCSGKAVCEASGASQFTLTAGQPLAHVQLFDAGIYAEDQWRVRPNISLSLGLRFESQNDINDHADLAPRIGLAWGLGRGAAPKTVLRAGSGIFYDRFEQGQILQAERLNGITEREFVVPSPDFFPNTPPLSELAALSVSQNTVYRVDPNLRAPYLIQSAVGLERQVAKNSTVSVTYLNSHGVHQLLTRNVNAPLPGTYPLNPQYPLGDVGNIYQYESNGLFNQNQLIANFNVRAGTRLSLFGFYTLNYAKSDTAGVNSFPMNQYDILEDYGRAAFDVRHRLFTGGSFDLPHGFRIFPFMFVSSGAPFNITTGQEFNGDSIFNARPAFNSGFGPGSPVQKAAFNPNPAPGEPLIPINYGTGPGQVSLNLRLSKVFGFGEKKGSSGGPGGFGGGGHHGPGGLGGRGLSGGGGPGGFFRGAPSNSRYTLEFSVMTHNVFNIVNLAQPVGSLTSPLFGRSNSIVGGFGGGQGYNRRIDLQARFSF